MTRVGPGLEAGRQPDGGLIVRLLGNGPDRVLRMPVRVAPAVQMHEVDTEVFSRVGMGMQQWRHTLQKGKEDD